MPPDWMPPGWMPPGWMPLALCLGPYHPPHPLYAPLSLGDAQEFATRRRSKQTWTGASIPSEAMMHFHPVSDSPPIFEKFCDFLENFKNLTFSRKNFPFSSAKISDDLFFSH